MNRAFLVVVKDDNRYDSVVASPTAAKARYQCYRAARDAGYRFNFSDFAVKRAPQYDAWAADIANVCGATVESVECVLREKRRRDEYSPLAKIFPKPLSLYAPK